MSEKILAEIITYDPDIDILKENIEATIEQVDKLLVFDNGSQNYEQIMELADLCDKDRVLVISNEENLGVAKALAYGVNFAKTQGYAYLLTLDQDTVIAENAVAVLSDAMQQDDMLALVGCGDIYELNEEFKLKDNGQIEYQNEIITAGSLFRVKVADVIGNYNEDLFIDWVDNEFCYRMISAGFKVGKHGGAGMKHRMGEPQIRRFLWKEIYVLNYSPKRLYYIYRNGRYCLKKYGKLIPARRRFVLYIKLPLTILLYEKEKCRKLKALLRGRANGEKMLHGNAIPFEKAKI